MPLFKVKDTKIHCKIEKGQIIRVITYMFPVIIEWYHISTFEFKELTTENKKPYRFPTVGENSQI